MEEISRRMMVAFKEIYELCKNSLREESINRLSYTQVQQIDALREPLAREVREPPQKEVR